MVPTFHSSRFSIQVWAGIAHNLKTPLVVLPLAPRKKRPGPGNQWDPAENLTAVRYRNWIIDGPLRDAVTAWFRYSLIQQKGAPPSQQVAVPSTNLFDVPDSKNGKDDDSNPNITPFWRAQRHRKFSDF
ncbi:hypothetical protein NDA13_001086 [Ustilago tritici]|nr:hypothetical protein NDA13_001086 [Ustilago tritici]